MQLKELDKRKVYMAEHVEIDNYWILGIYNTEEKAWRACLQYFIDNKKSRTNLKPFFKRKGLSGYYLSYYKKLQVSEMEVK